MSIFLRGACALLMTAGVALAGSDDQAEQALFTGAESEAGSIQQTCSDCGPTCGPVCDLGVGGGMGGGMGAGQVFVGAEWLSVRTEFSEATAYREQITGAPEVFHQFDMDYGSSYRIYGGYRLCECGGEVRFTYTNFNSDGGGVSDPNPNLGTDGRTFIAPWEIALGDGDQLETVADVNINNYDIGFSKTIPLGCPLACGGCGDCADCCDPCCGPVCPAWDITWTGALRFADVNSSLSYRDITSTVSPRSAVSTVDFDGVGFRFGLTGRRYFGRSGMLSAYLKGDISLLLGDVTNTVTQNAAFTGSTMTSTQVVPITEIEAGLTGYLTQNVSVSVGYLLSAWHDLGHRTEYNYLGSPTQVVSLDDANMMTLDGFFVRAEAAF